VDAELLEFIRATNREVQVFMDQVIQNGAKTVRSAAALRRLEQLNRRLERIAEHLGSGPSAAPHDPEGEHELRKYAKNLKNLRSVVETFERSLRAEKSRLENARRHLRSASAWAASLQDIS